MQQASKREIGNIAEDQALAYLQTKGLQLVTRNYQTKAGEIDLIMKDPNDEDCIVFVEVRYRNIEEYGDGAASISRSKQQKLIKTATYYLVGEELYDKVPCRFDVVSMTSTGMEPEIDWIVNAFPGF